MYAGKDTRYAKVLLRNRNRATSFCNSFAGGLRCSVDGEDEFLLHVSPAKELHRALTADDAELREGGDVVRSCRYLRLQDIEVEGLVDDLRWAPEATELGLTADERSLTSFETKVTTLTDTGLLTLRTATCCGTGTGCISAGDALLILRRTSIGLEGLEHGGTA